MTNIVNRNKTSAQVGAALGVSSSTVARYAREGRIPFMETPGGQRRFDIAEVHKALHPAPAIAVSTEGASAFRAKIAIGNGGSGTRSAADLLNSVIRAVHSSNLEVGTPTPSAQPEPAQRSGAYLEEMIVSARRVLISSVVR